MTSSVARGLALVVAVLCLLTPVRGGWTTSYDAKFKFECKPNQYLSYIKSEHDGWYEDRRYEFRCTDLNGPTTDRCWWTANQPTYYDDYYSYTCPEFYYLMGMESEHDNFYEDRRTKYKCCDIKGLEVSTCKYNDYINSFDGAFTWESKDKEMIRGITSEHSDYYEDRRFKFYTCFHH